MEQFSLEKYLENPSRKVVTRDGRPVRILCTDAKDKYGCCIIAAIETDGEEEGYQFFKDGKAYSSKSSIEDCADLFFADEEEELTEFEKAVETICKNLRDGIDDIGDIHVLSDNLLNLARKEIEKSNPYSGKQKQGEQKPAWSEEDEKWMAYFERLLEYGYNKDTRGLGILCMEGKMWLKSLKDRVQPQPKQEWSIEDSERLLRIHQFMWANRKGDTDEIYQQEQDADWLMTLTPQPKQPVNTVWYNNMDDLIADAMIDEINKSNLFGSDKYNCIYWINSHREKNIEWSKEDEKMISLLIKIFEVNHPNEHFKVNPIGTINMEAISTKEIIDWLKSFKSRSNLYGKGYKDGYSAAKYNYWKPSEQQIMGMEIAINILTDKKFNIAANHLKSIYNDIKKL